MFSKYYIKALFVFVLVAGFIMFFTPVNAGAGAVLGCCINNSPSGNCVQCGTEDDSCQTEQVGACSQTVANPADCGGEGGGRGCFVPGAVCFQEDVNTGICGEAPAEPECTEDSQCQGGEGGFDGDICTDDSCGSAGVCVSIFDASNDTSCVAVAPTAIVPTLSQWGIIISTIILGFFAVVMLYRSKDSEI